MDNSSDTMFAKEKQWKVEQDRAKFSTPRARPTTISTITLYREISSMNGIPLLKEKKVTVIMVGAGNTSWAWE